MATSPALSTRPATPISQEQLQQELTKGSSSRGDAPKDDTLPPEKKQDVLPPEKEKQLPTVPNLMEKIGKSMQEKIAKAEGKGDEPQAEKKPAVDKQAAQKKEVVSGGDAPPPKVQEITLTEEEKNVMPHDSARVRARITFLHGEKKRIEAERDAAKKELEEARKLPQNAVNAEEVARLKEEHQRLQDEATKLRRRYDWENDSEAKAKYREPVALAEKAIEEAFKRNNFGEPTLAAIKEAGGFAAFSRSRATYPIEVIDPDTQEKKTVNYTAAELARSWLARMPIADAQLINQSVGRQEILQAEEKQAIQKAMDESKTYFENQTAAQRKAMEEAQANNKRLADEYEAWAKTTEASTDWMKDVEIPQDASEQDKKTIAERNAFAAELRAGLKKHPTTSLEYGQLKFDAAKAKYLERTMAEKDAEIERLTGELKKKAAAQRTTGKGGSLLVKDGHKPEEDKAKPGDTNVLAAINRAMQRKMGAGDDD